MVTRIHVTIESDDPKLVAQFPLGYVASDLLIKLMQLAKMTAPEALEYAVTLAYVHAAVNIVRR